MAKATKKAYDQFARFYEQKRLDPKKSFWNDFLDRPAMTSLIKNGVKNKKVLDLGCGTGLFTERLHKWGGIVTGADLSEAMLEIARERSPQLKFCQANARKLPFPSGAFEVVVSCLMVHYCPSLRPVFKEVARVLEPGGVFAFSFHHPFHEVLSFQSKKNKVSARVSENYFHFGRYEWTIGKMRLVSYHHTLEEFSEALHKNGFVIEAIKEPRPPKRARKIDPLSYQLTERFPSFCAIRARRL